MVVAVCGWSVSGGTGMWFFCEWWLLACGFSVGSGYWCVVGAWMAATSMWLALWVVVTGVWLICGWWLLVCAWFVDCSYCCVVGLWIVATAVWLVCGL